MDAAGAPARRILQRAGEAQTFLNGDSRKEHEEIPSITSPANSAARIPSRPRFGFLWPAEGLPIGGLPAPSQRDELRLLAVSDCNFGNRDGCA
jgi:hypothetical protein